MIVRNEERFLFDCLESIKLIADEIVIVDTGSTDNSKSIARSFNARIYDFPWCDDFATARNEALRHCHGEWILYIDADERLRPIEKYKLNRLLFDKRKVAYKVQFYPNQNSTAYLEYRIFRNDPRIRFNGFIHETVVPSIHAVANENGMEIGICDLTIDHVGYDGDQKNKHARNLPLLRRQLARDPNRIYCWWHLGAILQEMGDEKGAEEAWLSAIKIIRSRHIFDMNDSLPYAYLIRLYYSKDKNVDKLIEEAINLFPDHYYIIWIKAMILMSEHNFKEAIPLLKRLVSVDIHNMDAGQLSYDEKMFNVFSYGPLATCYYQIGMYKDSAVYYALAEQFEPDNIEYKIKRQFVSTRIKN
ncbi:MAG TPA: glycosyltransferase [Desulfobacteraceae bacterium]|nr:glycosyltransferase [Desulfobacteraceae bacterium]